jgi:hypothetical protein
MLQAVESWLNMLEVLEETRCVVLYILGLWR